MHVSKVERAYSRSVNVRKPDGSEVWIKHEARLAVDLNEADALALENRGGVDVILKTLSELVMGEVSNAVKEEKAKILSSVQKPFPENLPDEPFATKDSFKNLPKL